jgi:hypothetical protein
MGKKKGLHRLSSDREDKFPTLAIAGYEVTSTETWRYNCIAHAADDHDHWWESPVFYKPRCYWPPSAMRGYTIDALVSAFQAIGYTLCADGELEDGFDKVVLYSNDRGEWTHAAKQVADGSWSSKLGPWEDIRHATVEAIECPDYGKASKYMKRPKKRANAA